MGQSWLSGVETNSLYDQTDFCNYWLHKYRASTTLSPQCSVLSVQSSVFSPQCSVLSVQSSVCRFWLVDYLWLLEYALLIEAVLLVSTPLNQLL